MIKRTITYTDFEDRPITEDWYFNLREDELIDLQLEYDMADILTRVSNGKATQQEAVGFIKTMLTTAVGQRSEDGRKFIKNEQITADFKDTGAYAALLMEFIADPRGGAKFIDSLMPKGLEDKLSKLAAEQNIELPKGNVTEVNVEKKPQEMSREELIAAMRAKAQS
jgi:hypothetical protein